MQGKKQNFCLTTQLDSIASQSYKPGLYIVSTPIGNMGDVTLRAIYTLSIADEIYCEDTRTTAQLLNFYGIGGKKLLKLTDHDSGVVINKILSLAQNKIICLVSDAGTPLICDPGVNILDKIAKFNINNAKSNKEGKPNKEATSKESNINIFCIPGACSVAASVSVSGVNGSHFTFCGFFDEHKFKSILIPNPANLNSIVFFDNPKSIQKSIKFIKNLIPEYTFSITICLELTKINEKIVHLNYDEEPPTNIKGELVCLLHNISKTQKDEVFDLKSYILSIMEQDKFLYELKTQSIIEFLQKYHSSPIPKNITKKALYATILDIVNAKNK